MQSRKYNMLRGKLDAFRNKQIILLDKSLKEKANFYPTKRPHLRFLARNINEMIHKFSYASNVCSLFEEILFINLLS